MGTARIGLRRIIVEERVVLVLADSCYRRSVLVEIVLGSLIKRSLASLGMTVEIDGLLQSSRTRAECFTVIPNGAKRSEGSLCNR